MELIKTSKGNVLIANSRLKLAGSILTEDTYENGAIIGRENVYKKLPSGDTKTTQNEYSNYYRARTKLTDLINTNCDTVINPYRDKRGKILIPKFLSFTYNYQLEDSELAIKDFTKAIQRFNYYALGEKMSGLKYSSVYEYQKSGRIHFHNVFYNFPYTRKWKLEKIWRNGYAHIEKVNDHNNAGKYLTKYMTKEHHKGRLKGKKSYYTSRGLRKPLVSNYDELNNYLVKQIPEKYLIDKTEMLCNFVGNIKSRVWNIKDSGLLKSVYQELTNKI